MIRFHVPNGSIRKEGLSRVGGTAPLWLRYVWSGSLVTLTVALALVLLA